MTATVYQLDPNRPRRHRTSRPQPRPAAQPPGAPLRALFDSWLLALAAGNKSPATVTNYTWSLNLFLDFLDEHDLPSDAERVTADHARAFIAHELARMSAASVSSLFRNCRVFWSWVIEEGEREGPNPFNKRDCPRVPKKARRYLSDDEIRALLKTAEGRDFIDRRDTAIIRILADNGVRVSGLANLRYTPGDPETHDVDLKRRVLRIRLKGGDELWVPIGVKAAQALDRYIRARAGHPHADSPWLWLGVVGRNTTHYGSQGIREMLHRRAERAGVENVHPHRFRGTAAHKLLAAGAADGAVQKILGWKSREMVDHYTEELAAERAREVHARLSPGDRI